MSSTIMIGQLPLIIEREENVGSFASSSRHSLGQASNKDGELPPTDVTSNASNSDFPNEKLEHKTSSENQDDDNSIRPSCDRRKRKCYHRHTPHQIQEMEMFFKEFPHPDDKQRKKLSLELELKPLQVKFWFQNKRTQMKTHLERVENAHLKAENENLRAENIKYKEAITKASCPTCTGVQIIPDVPSDEHQLKMENARLREEIERVSSLAAKCVGKSKVNYDVQYPPAILTSADLETGAFGAQPDNSREISGEEDILRSLIVPSEIDKPMLIDLALASMEELIRVAQIQFPLWIAIDDNRNFMLDEDIYFSMFPREIGLRQAGFRVETSKNIDVVMMNYMNVIEVFMDMDKWLAIFASMVSRGLVLQVITPGAESGNYDGVLQVINAECQVLTPTVPTRESTFLRYCKKLSGDTWAIVDVSFDNLVSVTPLAKCQKRPSGCLIQEMPNGYSKITWIEHVEVYDPDVHFLGRPFVDSGLAFGAQRWVAVLSRQCERLSSALATNISPHNIIDIVLKSLEGRKNILKLSERMVISFCGGVTSSTAYSWQNLSGNGAEQVRIMRKQSENDPGKPSGVVLSATTSLWIPVPHKILFEYLCDEHNRIEWDILSNGGTIQELLHITSGNEAGNSVSLLRARNPNSSQGNMLILQEFSTDATSSSVIYSSVDTIEMQMLLGGGNPDHVALLPSGFSIYPSAHAPPMYGSTGIFGSLVTVGFQILVDSVPTAKLSYTTVSIINNLIESTTQRIKEAMAGRA